MKTKLIVFLLLFLPFLASAQPPYQRSPLTTNLAMNLPQDFWIPIWNNVAKKWSNGVNTASATNNAQPPSTTLSNLAATGVSPGATNAGFYIGSLNGSGTNTYLSGANTNVSPLYLGVPSSGTVIYSYDNSASAYRRILNSGTGLLEWGTNGHEQRFYGSYVSPGIDNTTDLGRTDLRWKVSYFYIGDFQGLLSANQLLVDGPSEFVDYVTVAGLQTNIQAIYLQGGAVTTTLLANGIKLTGGQTASRALVLDSGTNVTTATGTPDGTKFLRDDNTYAVPAGGVTPGGNSGAVQFNETGTFAGTNNFIFNRTNNTLTAPILVTGNIGWTESAPAGTGSGTTNYTLDAAIGKYILNAQSGDDGINITAIYGGTAGITYTFSITVTNAAANEGILFSNITNNWRWSYEQGGIAPTILTNSEELVILGELRGTNITASYAYFPWP